MIRITVQIEPDEDPEKATVISSAFENMDELHGFVDKVKVFNGSGDNENKKKKTMGFLDKQKQNEKGDK